MNSNINGILFLATFFLLIGCSDQTTDTEKAQNQQNITVVLSLDGFRWDYAAHATTPNLDRIAREGVVADALIPVFPTGTFANHYSMATGYYPDNHGIVANRFSCPILGEDYNKGDRSTVRDGKFYGGEPIWVTAQNQGLKTGTFFWVGSEADIKGIRPTYWKKYDNSFPYGDRIDTVVHWLSLPEVDRPDLIMWYYHQTDSDGHRYGPLGDSLLLTVEMKDSLIGVFLEKIERLPHRDKINFIVVSDHGMAEVDYNKMVHLDDHLDTSLIELIDGGSTAMSIKAKTGKTEELYNALSQVENLSVWKSGELPKRLNFGKHPRNHDLIILADPGAVLGWSWRNYDRKGSHGYDNQHPDMHGIFYAFGPDFKVGHHAKAFENINLYPLLAHLLDINGGETDANFSVVKDLLR